MSARRIRVVERPIGQSLQLRYDHPIRNGESLEIGRAAPVRIAVDPPDKGVSRLAVRVVAATRGWHLVPMNRQGVVLYCWGHPARSMSRPEPIVWSRLALRINGDSAHEHWVLLDDGEIYTVGAAQYTRSDDTERARAIKALTDVQLRTLRSLFADLLAWPPRSNPRIPTLESIARREGVSLTAVQERLRGAREKASQAGLLREVPLTDPEYLYVLIHAGLVVPEREDLHPLLRR